MERIINVTCQGMELVDVYKLKPIYTNLKQVKKKNVKKLQMNLLTFGYTFPCVVWKDPTGNNWVVNGHIVNGLARIMIEREGYKLKQLNGDVNTMVPVVYTNCKNMVEAKEKALLYASAYGRITHEGFNEFLFDPEAPLSIERIKEFNDIPRFSVAFFEKSYMKDEPIDYNPEAGEEDEKPKTKKKYVKISYKTEDERQKILDKLNVTVDKEEYNAEDIG